MQRASLQSRLYQDGVLPKIYEYKKALVLCLIKHNIQPHLNDRKSTEQTDTYFIEDSIVWPQAIPTHEIHHVFV